MSDLTTGYEWTNGATVTAARLNAAIEAAVLKGAAISGKSELAEAPASGDFLLLWDASANGGSGGLVKISQANLLGLLVPGVISGQAEKSSLVDADTFLIWDSEATALKKITRANLIAAFQPAGTVLQTKYVENAAHTALTGFIPIDDTVPLISEGNEVLSETITPQSSANSILVTFNGFASCGTDRVTVVIFRGTTALQTTVTPLIGSNATSPIPATVLDSPATTSALTYSVRIGATASSAYLNGVPGGRNYGGSSRAIMTLQEIKG